MTVTLTPATPQDLPLLQNLLALYLHDLSAYSDDLQPNDEGLFVYEALPYYFEKESLSPLFIRNDGHVVGFLLLNRPPYAPPDVDYLINEFFLLRAHRGKGLAQAAVRETFAQHPGRYLLLELKRNTPAIRFWHRLLNDLNLPYKEEENEFQGEPCFFQRFTVPA